MDDNVTSVESECSVMVMLVSPDRLEINRYSLERVESFCRAANQVLLSEERVDDMYLVEKGSRYQILFDSKAWRLTDADKMELCRRWVSVGTWGDAMFGVIGGSSYFILFMYKVVRR